MTEQHTATKGMGEATLTTQQQRDILVRLGIKPGAVKTDSVTLADHGDGQLLMTFTCITLVHSSRVADLL